MRHPPPYDFSLQTVSVFANSWTRRESVLVRPVGLDLLPDAIVKLNETLIGHIRETRFHLSATSVAAVQFVLPFR